MIRARALGSGTSPVSMRHKKKMVFVQNSLKLLRVGVPIVLFCVVVMFPHFARGKQSISKPDDKNGSEFEESDRIKLQVRLSTNTCYVHEAVLLEVEWGSRLDWSRFLDVNLEMPVFHANWCDLDNIHSPIANGDGNGEKVGLPVSNTRVLARAIPAKKTGEWQWIEFRKVLIPAKAGEFNVGDARLRTAVVGGSSGYSPNWDRYPSYFDNNFFECEVPERARRIQTSSSLQKLTVHALPPLEDGTNVIAVCGGLDISATADRHAVRVGEPVNLTLTIETDTFPESVRRPSIEPLLRTSGFEIQPLETTPEYSRNRVSFKYVISPSRSSVTNVPAFEAVYFNPEDSEYQTAVSRSIALQIESAPRVGYEDARGPGMDSESYATYLWIGVALAGIAATVVVFMKR